MKRVRNLLLSAGLALLPLSQALAEGWNPPANVPTNAPDNLDTVILNATNWILGMVSVIAVLAIIWGGIQYLTSAGNQDQARDGKRTITYAVIGLVVAGIAYALVYVIITKIITGSGGGGNLNGQPYDGGAM
jgi:amino acid transporter